MMQGIPSPARNRFALCLFYMALTAAAGSCTAMAQEGVRLSTLPSARSAPDVKPLAAGRGFNIGNVRQASVARPVRRVVAVRRMAALSAPGATSPPSAIVEHRASGMRLIGSVSIQQFSNVLDAQERVAVAGLTTDSTQHGQAQRMSRFIGQTMQYVDVRGDLATAGWWNPFDDAWIVTNWRRMSVGWKIERMSALLGVDLDKEMSSPNAATSFSWPNRPGGLASVLAEHNQTGIQKFMAFHRSGTLQDRMLDTARQQRAWRTILARRTIQEAMLARVLSQPGYKDVAKAVAGALAPSAPAALSDSASRQRVLALPANVRATLRPAMVAQRDGKTLFLLQSPLAPAFVVFMEVEAGTNGAPARPARYSAMSLNVGSGS